MEDRIIVDCILKDGKKNLFSLIVKNYGGMVFSRAIGITKGGQGCDTADFHPRLHPTQQLERKGVRPVARRYRCPSGAEPPGKGKAENNHGTGQQADSR